MRKNKHLTRRDKKKTTGGPAKKSKLDPRPGTSRDQDDESAESNFSDNYDREDDFDDEQSNEKDNSHPKKSKTVLKPKKVRIETEDELGLFKDEVEEEDGDALEDGEDDEPINDLEWEDIGGGDENPDDEAPEEQPDETLITKKIDEHNKKHIPEIGWEEVPKEVEPEDGLKARLFTKGRVDPETGVLYPSESLLSQIKNKQKRRELYEKYRAWKKKDRMKAKKEKKKEAEAKGEDYVKPVPKTIESCREEEETWVEEADEEVHIDMDLDEMSSYFRREYEPKVLITTSDNPHSNTIQFARELKQSIPNAEFRWRNRSAIKKIVVGAKARGYTDLIVIHEDWRRPTGMIICHLPEGPTAYFRLSSPRLCKKIPRRTEYTSHRPEVILNNFNTRVGHTVGRMLACLFHYDPQFQGRRVVTFHNQRDYIFFRHHRYQFTKNGTRVALAEIGPRFTLKLRAVQRGTFDPKYGEFEWVLKRHEMQKSRRKFML